MDTKFVPHKQIGMGDFKFGPLEKKYLEEVVQSNRLSHGPMSEKFEKAFASEHDCKFGLFSNSGTSSLHVAIAALQEKYGWQDGDEVIVPAITFIATSNVILHNRLTPVFVDVDPRTYNIDPSKIEAAITPRTRAILPVHLFGLPCDMDPIMAIARKHDLRVVEDSCETMFASYKGKRVGSFGDIGCFSTYVAHFLVTGVGGLSTTNDPELAVLMKSLVNHGRDSIYLTIDDDKDLAPDKLAMVVAKRFSFERLGHSFRATEMEAALGVAQLEQKDAIIARRAAIAARYTEAFAGLTEKVQLPFVPADCDHRFMMYPMVVRDADKRDVVNFLEARKIETRDMMPLVSQPIYKKLFGDIEKNYPVAQWINRSGFYIPCHQYLTDEEVEYIIGSVQDFFAHH